MKKTAVIKAAFILLTAILFQTALLFAEEKDSMFTDEEDFISSFSTKEEIISVSKLDFNDFDFVILADKTEGYTEYTIGENSQAITAKRYLSPYKMNRYETTYSLWYAVRLQSAALGYTFYNPGQEGSEGRRGRAPTAVKQFQPVTMISWYDAIIWCNALSELNGKTPCYTFEGLVLRDSSDTVSCDLCQCNFDADGYRLPTEAEWEYAARLNGDSLQKGDCVSGQDSSDSNILSIEKLCWISENSKGTHTVGTAGSLFDANVMPDPGSGNSNASGIFDMTGNVLEYCWDWFSIYSDSKEKVPYTGPEFGEERISRGGSWSQYTPFHYTGDRYSYDPNEAYNYMGFRIVCSVK